MCFSNLSGCDLLNLSSCLAISISKDFSSEDLSLLAAFLTSFADNLALLAVKKSLNLSNNLNDSNDLDNLK